MMRLTGYAQPAGLVLRVALGLFFLYAGGEKLFRLDDFVQDVANYRIVYPPVDGLVGYVLPWVELFTGLALVFGVICRGALLSVIVLSIVFMVGIGSAWFRGLSINCGCFGASDAPTNYPGHLLLNLGILLLAVVLLLRESRRNACRRLTAGQRGAS